MPKSIDISIPKITAAVICICLTAGAQLAFAKDAGQDTTVPAEDTQAAAPAESTTFPEAAVQEAVILQEPSSPADETTASMVEEPSSETTAAAPEDQAPAQPIDPVTTTGETAPAQEVETIPVAATEAPATLTTAEDATPVVQLEDVIVTSTKRVQSLRDIPASITEFNGDKLEEQGKLNLTDYLQSAPGVTLTAIAPNFPRISIRGISTDTNGLASIPSPTGIFIGDVAFSDPYISNIQPDLSAFDLQSVEVLKGPQGTLFGGAALAGAIRYVLQDPAMGEWQARGFTQYVSPTGGSTALSSGLAVNLPLYSDRLALRVGYVKRNYPGYTDLPDKNPPEQDVDEGDGDQIRGLLAWQPLDELKFKLTHLSQDYSAANSTNTASTPDRREKNRQVLPSPVKSKFQLDSLEASWDFSSTRLVSLTSYTTKQANVAADATAALIGIPPEDYPPALAAFLTFDDDSKAFAQEIRLQSSSEGSRQWLVGLYLYDYSVRFEILGDTVAHQTALGNSSAISALLAGVRVDTSTLYNKSTIIYGLSQPKAQERALFFDLSNRFWGKLELSAGARLYSTLIEGGFFGTGVLALGSNNGMDVRYENNSIKENGVSPKVTATWHFNDDMSLYGQVARGFRFGGLQSVPSTPISEVPQAYKSDTLWNMEIGLRTRWLERTLQADLTVFNIDYQDPQINQSTQGLPLTYVDNVGGAISRGLEASLRWLTPLSGLSLALDGALTDAYTTEAFTASGGQEVPAGTQMPGAAKSQYSASAAYLAQVGIANLGTSVNYTYIGKGFSDLVHSVAINDYGTLNAGLTLGTDAWSLRPQLAFNVSNILDTTAVVGGGTGKSIIQTTATTYSLNAPRTFSIRLSLSY